MIYQTAFVNAEQIIGQLCPARGIALRPLLTHTRRCILSSSDVSVSVFSGVEEAIPDDRRLESGRQARDAGLAGLVDRRADHGAGRLGSRPRHQGTVSLSIWTVTRLVLVAVSLEFGALVQLQ